MSLLIDEAERLAATEKLGIPFFATTPTPTTPSTKATPP